MKTSLDSQSWSSSLYQGNSQFLQSGSTIYVVSNVRSDGSFAVFASTPIPPAPGPGYSFTQIASYTFANPTKSFDPVCYLNGTVLHIVGAVNNATYGIDLLKFKIDLSASTPTLSTPVTIVSGSSIRDAYDVLVLSTTSVPVVVCAITNPSTPSHPNQHVLLALELDPSTDATVTTHVLATSTVIGGNAFGAISLASPDGSSLEVYYESYPKSITFKDVLYSINLITCNSSSVWQTPITLYTFVGSMADSRMTVIQQGVNRYISQVFFNNITHRNAFVGSLLLGYYNGISWQWAITPGPAGSEVAGSIIQASLSVSETQGVNVAYLSQPAYSRKGPWSSTINYAMNDQVVYNKLPYVALVTTPKGGVTPDINPNWGALPTSWPLHIARVNLSGLSIADTEMLPTTLTWVRGGKSIADDQSLWELVGECEAGGVITPVYMSNFDVPPIASITPTSATVYRNAPLSLSASSTIDEDNELLQYVWVDNSMSPFVSVSGNGAEAVLNVSDLVGGTAQNFLVAVIVFDLAGGVNIHPPMNVTSVLVVSNVLTVVTDSPVSLADGQDVLLYGMPYIPALNLLKVTTSGSSGNQFTATLSGVGNIPINYVSGSAVAQFDTLGENGQFAVCTVSVPPNVTPSIDFHTDRITGLYVSTPIQAARNSNVSLNPIVFGMDDADDVPSYLWSQITGTAVTFVNGATSPTLTIATNGVSVLGETLTFQLTASDGVNPDAVGTISVQVAPYDYLERDTHLVNQSTWEGNISQRNTVNSWGASVTIPVPSSSNVLTSDLLNVKRSTVVGSGDKEVLVSSKSIIVYDGTTAPEWVRVFLTPGCVPVVDAFHTEEDTTLVLDTSGRVMQYTTAPLTYSDNPTATIHLSDISNFTFNRIFSTANYGGSRVLFLSGVNGCLLLQVGSNLQILDSVELSVETFTLYGADNVQWIRTEGVTSLSTGKVLVGTVLAETLDITSITITNNALTVATENSLVAGEWVTLSNLVTADFLNGVRFWVLSATPYQFVASFAHPDYPTTLDSGVGTLASSYFETLIDLSQMSIAGTWNGSNLRNQTVTSGELLFDYGVSYSGAPTTPVLSPIVENGTGGCVLTWDQAFPALVSAYLIEVNSSSNQGGSWTGWSILDTVRSGTVTSVTEYLVPGVMYQIRVQAQSVDGTSSYSNVVTILGPLIPTPSNTTPAQQIEMVGISVVTAIPVFVIPQTSQVESLGVSVVSTLPPYILPLALAEEVTIHGVSLVSNLPVVQQEEVSVQGCSVVSNLPVFQTNQVSLGGAQVVSTIPVVQTDQIQSLGVSVVSGLTVVQESLVAVMGVSAVSTIPFPVITSLSSTSGFIGSEVNITGVNFGAAQGVCGVSFNGVTATITSWSTGVIAVSVPNGATSGIVKVTVNGIPSNGVEFTVTFPPTITLVSPMSAISGSSVVITGTSFGSTQGASTISIGGIQLAATSWSATSIAFSVPPTAISGNLLITVGGLTSAAVWFNVTPDIMSLTPSSGSVGAIVALTGTGFGSVASVTFNGIPAAVISCSNISITAVVPSLASTGNVVVNTGVSNLSNGVIFTVV